MCMMRRDVMTSRSNIATSHRSNTTCVQLQIIFNYQIFQQKDDIFLKVVSPQAFDTSLKSNLTLFYQYMK